MQNPFYNIETDSPQKNSPKMFLCESQTYQYQVRI